MPAPKIPAGDDELAGRLADLVARRGGKVTIVPGGRMIYLPDPDRDPLLTSGSIPGAGQVWTAAQFGAWVRRRKLRFEGIARLLNERMGARYTSSVVGRWVNGTRPVPVRISAECAKIDAEEREARRAAKAAA